MKEFFGEKKILYIIIYLILYVSFLFIDLQYGSIENSYSYLIKYSCIVLNFIMVLFIRDYTYSKNDRIYLTIALFFTLLADFTLIFIGNYTLGVLFFCIVQLSYIKRHSKKVKDTRENIILVIIFLTINFLMAFMVNKALHLYLKGIDTKLVFIVLIYFALLITSLIRAFSVLDDNYYNIRTKYFISIGMLLFFLCDVNVGIYNILNSTNLFVKYYSLKDMTGFLIWFFYAPSQLLLTLSCYNTPFYKKQHTKG